MRLSLAIVLAYGTSLIFGSLLLAQDDVTTRNGSSAVDGGWITGPASNPLSFLNGPEYRTFGSTAAYDFPDFHPASCLDEKLPRWIDIEAEERFRFEGYRNGSFQVGNDDNYMLNRLRLQVDLRPVPWVRFSLQTQDARPILQKPPIGPPNENEWDLKLAYAEFGDPEQQWISLRIGRQLINYNNTLIANSEWRNQGRSYDAAVVNLQKGRYHLGVFAASAVVPLAAGISHHQEGNNIYGAYGRIDSAIPKSTLEPFVLWRVQPSAVVEPAVSSGKAKQDLKAFGIRWKGMVKTAFDYSAEGVIENGNVGQDRIEGWATTDGIAYQKSSLWGKPRAYAQFDYASGNSNSSQGVHRTFDTIYPTAHDRFGILDVFGWQNIKSIRGGATIIPYRRWTVTAQYLDLWLAQANDAVYNSSGTSIGRGNAAFGTHLGAEGDFYSWFEFNRHFNVGAGFGRISADELLSHLAGAQAYSSYYVALNFKDNGRWGAKE